MTIKGQIIDIFNRRIFPGIMEIADGKILTITETETAPEVFIMPGLVNAHVHIESSMLVPSRFAALAVRHGTVASVSDPHEIANVLGVDGIDFMIRNSREVPFKAFFGLPSCVPATPFETSGAVVDAKMTETLLQRDDIWYLAEMMNYPGVVFEDADVHRKIKAANAIGKPIDGHAPYLSGDALKKYASAGITTDHECTNIVEAKEKIAHGMKILIREGSAAKDFEALWPLIDLFPDEVMLCTDDSHPDDLAKGHLNSILARAISKGLDTFNILRSATLNPVLHYKIPVGLMRVGDAADFIVLSDFKSMNVLETWINGECVYRNGETLFGAVTHESPNKFVLLPLMHDALIVPDQGKDIRVIVARDGDLVTRELILKPMVKDGHVVVDVSRDLLKLVVINRYEPSQAAIGFIKGFGLKQGAIAGSVAHDSHNIVAVGVDDESMLKAINAVIESRGGLVVTDGHRTEILPLPVAGLMSNEDGLDVAKKYDTLGDMAQTLGTTLHAPFMTLSFMALLVIPELKLGDKGLFDGRKFEPTSLFV